MGRLHIWPKNSILQQNNFGGNFRLNIGLLIVKCEQGFNDLFTLHGRGNRAGNGKRWVSVLYYVLYTLHSDSDRDREPLFSIVPIPVPVLVPFPVPCSMYEPEP